MRKNDFNPGGTRILRFNLKQRKMESRLTQIMLVTTVDGRRIRVYTKLRVEPRYWDGATYRCRADAGVNQRERSRLAGINRQLVQLEQSVLAEDERLADRGGVLSADVLRRVVTHCLTGGEGAGSPLEYLRRLVTDYAGSINRRELGRLLFRYPDLLERHERILFPRINALLKAFIRENAGRHVVINAPLLFKSEAAALCDFVLLITAPAVIRLWRAKKRDGLPFRQIWQRFSAQKALFTQNISANTDIVRVGNGAGKRSLEKKLKAALRRKGIEAEYPEN